MHDTKYVTKALAASLAQPSTLDSPRASRSAEAASAELAQRREATRKYVERVNRYLGRDDAARQTFTATAN